jgi:hypothetical protein
MGFLDTIRRATAAQLQRVKAFANDQALIHRADRKLHEISCLEADLASLRCASTMFTTRTGMKVESQEVKQLRSLIATREKELADLLDQIDLRQGQVA